MKIIKNELKQSAIASMPSSLTSAVTRDDIRLAKRIETILRASINHLSYDLCMDKIDGKNAIFLKNDDRIIVIERNPDTFAGPTYHEPGNYVFGYQRCMWAFHVAERIIKQVKGDLAKKETATTTSESKTLRAD